MTEIIIAVATKVSEYLVAPIGRQLSYLFCYRGRMDDLNKKVQELELAKDDLQITVDAAIRRGDEIRPIVQDWLTRADKNTGEAKIFMEDEKKRTKSCFNGWCPNLKSRYLLSREADKKAQVIVEVQGNRNFPDGVSYRVPPRNVTFKNYEPFESRASTLDKVMDALRDYKIKRIGVWGLGGVGKTTLVNQVAKLAEDGKLFDKVVMVAVPREQNLENIQAEIADFLALNIEEKSKLGRANRQIEILKKKKLLIILDDIWAKLDLEAVGIPCGDDHVECKIVVTSRSIDVLSQEMGTQPNFEIRILSDNEAWQLFQNTAGDCFPEFNLQSVARKVAEKCGGLPVALVTVAKALKTKSLPCWEDALRQLTSPVKTDIRGLDEKVYKSLELSYDSVKSEDAKLLFLLCGLMGYGDISLDDLFKCSLGLGLFQGINTLDRSTNRLQALVDRLKSSSLLLDIDEENVKMHDVVRDVARQLASKDPRYMVIEATQSGIHESTRCVHLSLSHEGTLDLGEILDHPKIEFFRLVNEGRPLKIPDPLFNGMGKLKVLHLFQMEFSSLPLSLQSLANLRTLCLHCCTLGGVAGIGELKELEVLSFWGSKIVQLPREIAQLICLRWLDLRNCYQLQVIPPNILSNLSQLEHLCMEISRFTQSEDEEINQERNACLAELKHLSRLTTLNIALQDLKLLPKDMVFEKLTRFKIFIGGVWNLDSPCETKRALKLYKAGGSLHLVDGIGKLLKKTEELSLRELSGTKSVFHESYKEDFLQLKHLDVDSSPEIQYIVDSKYPRVQEHVLFPLLESLLLRDLINLEKVCHGPIPRGSFGNLKTLKVSECPGLKNFLSLIMATDFLHLQKIKIEDCDVMQQIIAFERQSKIIEDGHGTTLQLFPKLRSLKLDELPELMNFSSKVETTSSTSLTNSARSEGNCDIHMSFFSNQVSFPNLEKLILHNLPKLREIWHHQLPLGSFYNLQILQVHNCPSLLNLIPSHLIRRFNNLKELKVDNCEVLKHVFDLQGLDGNIKILPRLESLCLWKLPKLRHVVCNENDDKNDSVKYRFSSSTAFHKLKFLSITNCGNKVEDEGHINTPMEDVVLFDGKVSFPNLEKLILDDLPKLREIWHHQLPLGSLNYLKILEVQNCPGLFNLIPSHLIQSFDNLKELEVSNCKVLKHVFDLQGLDENIRILPRLESLRLNSLPKLRRVVCNEDEDKNDSVRCPFSSSIPFHNLKFLYIKDCGNEVEDEEHINTPTEDVVLFDGKVSFPPNLEELVLERLPKLKEMNVGILLKLKILKLEKLPRLRLMVASMFKNFHNLQKLHIIDCGMEDGEDVNTPSNDVVFSNEKVSFPPNLEELVLRRLPKLMEMDVGILPKLKILKLEEPRGCLLFKVSLSPNLEEIVLKSLPKLEEIDFGILPKLKILKVEKLPQLVLSSSMFKNFHNLKELRIIDCGMEDMRGVNTSTNDEVLFNEKVSFPPNLEELVLKNLPKWTEIDIGNFSKLKILKLKKLHECHLFKVSLSPNLEEIVLKSLPKLKEIDFGILPKLKILKVEKLPQLRHIICNEDKNFSKRCVLSPSMFKNFHNLRELHIIDCGMEDMRGANTSTNDEVLFNEKASFLESRASTLNKIMDALRDHNINLIGVWGMAGVGKTTLLKQVAQQAKQQRLFTRQAYMDVSWTRDSDKRQEGIVELQREIAKALDLPFWRPTDELMQRLKEEKILIILDDIWTEVDLEQVGIPSKDDIWTQCKIVLASRDGDLLCKDMGTQICFPVEHLPPEEAWSLFKKTTGDSVEENLELRPIAIQVVEECEGLPIAIVTIAKALKDETVAVWKNALEQLRSCAPTNIRAVDKKVYSCLEWSYTHLKGDDVKSLFLLCGMLGYGDISLDLLLRYGMGLDLFDRTDSLEQARNRLLALVENLKDSGLLLDSHEDTHKFDEEIDSSSLFMDADNKFVRMHNVVCEVARAIASKDPHPFVVRKDVGVEEWSETDESKRCAFISLHCKAVHDLPQELVWPELQFFLLQNNNPPLNIPNTFFEGMKKLKVLDLSRMHFTTLPSSLDSLANLRTLRLDGCELGDIALIGKLKKLEVLSLVGSTIQRLPKEMMQLTNLRLLDLDGCEKLEVIPRNILSSLSRLECLSMISGFTKWAVEGESNACLSELNHLSYLTTLFIEIPDAKLLPKDILFENLTRYGISMGDWWGFSTKKALKLNRSLHLEYGMSKLLERSEELTFWELSGTKYVLHLSDRESFRELKHLKVRYSPEIQYIIDSKDQWFLQHGAFPLLESLILWSLENFEEVWHGPIPIGSFGNLKTLKVRYCPKLKFLLLLSTARGLSQLEEMTIKDCNAMQQIIAYERESEIEEDGHVGTNLQLFPKLRSLKLKRLPQLINFSSELQTTSSTSLSTNARSEDSFFSHKVSFPKLEKLTLTNLPKLKDIWHHQLPFESFSNLQILRVYECPCLLNLVPAHLIHNFQNLKEIDVQLCELLEHVIILQEIDGNVEILSKLETLKLKYLPRLRWIEDGNDRMKHISSLLTLMNIQNLQELHIIDCSMEDLRKM